MILTHSTCKFCYSEYH